jgi:CubicO group peptidase (beta-lactamase class C family)
MSTASGRCYDLAEFRDLTKAPFRIACVLLLAFASAEHRVRAQGLAVGLFERYLDPLRVQAGIPGLSAAIVQNGRIVWERPFGSADLERSIRVDENTPFFIADLSQTIGATVLMQRVEHGDLDLQDRISRWTPLLPEQGATATVLQALTHTTTGSYDYKADRFSVITPIIEFYTNEPYRLTVAREILEHSAMFDSVPGYDLDQPNAFMREIFDADDLARYQAVLRRMAVPYRVDGRGRPIRSNISPRNPAIDASTGLVTTARDLWRFDTALDEGTLIGRDLLGYMRNGAQPGTPRGLGWFVQAYNGERLVWHFGLSPNAYSSLILKVPSRNLTLILLANSDGLSAPFALERGDVTTSLFAKLFLSLFVS